MASSCSDKTLRVSKLSCVLLLWAPSSPGWIRTLRHAKLFASSSFHLPRLASPSSFPPPALCTTGFFSSFMCQLTFHLVGDTIPATVPNSVIPAHPCPGFLHGMYRSLKSPICLCMSLLVCVLLISSNYQAGNLVGEMGWVPNARHKGAPQKNHTE